MVAQDAGLHVGRVERRLGRRRALRLGHGGEPVELLAEAHRRPGLPRLQAGLERGLAQLAQQLPGGAQQHRAVGLVGREQVGEPVQHRQRLHAQRQRVGAVHERGAERGALRVVGDDHRSVVSFEEEPAPRLLGNLVRPLMDPLTHLRNHRSLRRLAALVERGGPQRPAERPRRAWDEAAGTSPVASAG